MTKEDKKLLVDLINIYGLNCIEFGKRVALDKDSMDVTLANKDVCSEICKLLDKI